MFLWMFSWIFASYSSYRGEYLETGACVPICNELFNLAPLSPYCHIQVYHTLGRVRSVT